MHLRLHGQEIREKSDGRRDSGLPRALPLPGPPAGGGVRLDRGNAEACAQLPLGPLGTGGHARPVHDALGGERDAGEGASLLHARRDEERHLPLRGSARTPRPVRIPSVRRLVTSEGNMAQEHKFRFSCEYMDDELVLIYYNYRHLNPHDGRWISRDPIAEQGGWNLFAFVGNRAYYQYDKLGLWLARRHRRLTRRSLSSYKFQIDINGKSISLPIKKELLEIIVEANVDTDSGEMGKNQAYHYCTGLDSNETFETAKRNYISTLAIESKKFYDTISKQMISLEDCKDALKTLGHLNHMWQDYYAHGVEEDNAKKAVVGKIQGSPEMPIMIPVSFGSMGFKGGHGGFWRVMNPFSRVEPGDRATDSNIRKQQAKSYTKIHSIPFLSAWFAKCKCHFYSEEINR